MPKGCILSRSLKILHTQDMLLCPSATIEAFAKKLCILSINLASKIFQELLGKIGLSIENSFQNKDKEIANYEYENTLLVQMIFLFPQTTNYYCTK